MNNQNKPRFAIWFGALNRYQINLHDGTRQEYCSKAEAEDVASYMPDMMPEVHDTRDISMTIVSPVTYYYSPIPFYNGKVLKCQGMVSEENRAWMPTKYPGIIELEGYQGDRITADTHEVFNG